MVQSEEKVNQKETGRTEAFSDGVFAIAMTLLVLDLKVPKLADLASSGDTLLWALLQQWPLYLAYITSFFTVLIMWINHHRILRNVRKVDHVFLLINGLLLMCVTIVPFSTSLLAAFINHPYERLAAAIYAGIFILIGLSFNLLWHHAATRSRLLLPDTDVNAVRAITRQYRLGPVLYAAAFLMAFFKWQISVGACIALAIFFAIPIPAKKSA